MLHNYCRWCVKRGVEQYFNHTLFTGQTSVPALLVAPVVLLLILTRIMIPTKITY